MAIKSGIISLDMNVLLDGLGEGKREPKKIIQPTGALLRLFILTGDNTKCVII